MPIRLEVDDYIAVITLDNPPLNIWEEDWSETLEDIVDSFHGRDDVRVAIITGTGDRAFTAGLNVNPKNPSPRPMRRRSVRNYHQALLDCAVPIIGAINGYTLGHGIVIASALDMLIGSENASFGLPEINTGGFNGGRFFMRLFPYGFAHYAVYTGERIDAHEAYRLGALLKVVPPADLMKEAMDLATLISEKAPLGIQTSKFSLKWVEDMDAQRGYEFEGEYHVRHYINTPEGAAQAEEARLAFVEKRTPNFG
jgi:enoyl-CoA hydratase